MQLTTGGVISAARAPRSSEASELTIACRFDATQPVRFSPTLIRSLRSAGAAGPKASATDRCSPLSAARNHAPDAPEVLTDNGLLTRTISVVAAGLIQCGTRDVQSCGPRRPEAPVSAAFSWVLRWMCCFTPPFPIEFKIETT